MNTERLRRAGILSFFLALIFVFSLCMPVLPVKADLGEIDGTPVDFVLVLDCSGTMPANDPDKLTAAASKMFIDLLPKEQACRLGIVVFGADYGADAYNICPGDAACRNLIKVAYPLQNINTDASKSKAKEVIVPETSKSGALSPVGYALQTATQILEEGKAAKGQAAIILLTDGQVEGQSDGYNPYRNMHMDYTSMETALSVAGANNWDVYGMEFNFAGANKKDATNFGAIGYYQMRENIPAKTGTEPLELRSAEQADAKFREIIAKFFKAVVVEKETGPHYEEELGNMIAEWSVTFTSKYLDKVTGVKLTSPDNESLNFVKGSASQGPDNVVAVFDDQYIMLKVYAPEAGKWSIDIDIELDQKVLDENKGIFKAASVRMTQTNLILYASAESGELSSSTTVDFKADFEYGDTAYKSENFYNDHPAKLYINDEPVMDMTASAEGYEATYTFEKKGSYSVYARVDDEGFRKGYKTSGKFVYTIDNEPTGTKGVIPDISANCGSEAEGIRLADFFDSPDGDTLSYSVSYDTTVNIGAWITEEGILIMRAGSQAGTYEVTVSATDNSDGDLAVQTFNFEITNQPLNFKGIEEDKYISLELSPDSGDLPKSKEYKWESFFNDPDGQPPRIAVIEDLNENGCVSWMQDRERTGITFTADKSGKARFSVVAMDDNDIRINYTVIFEVDSISKKDALIEKYRLPAILFAALLLIVIVGYIALFAGRRIYGRWNIYSNNRGYAADSELNIGRTRSGKRVKCRLDNLLMELDMEGGFGNVCLVAGNKLSGKVYLINLGEMAEVQLDGIRVDDPKKLKKLEIRRGHDVRINSATNSITLTRVS